MLIAQTVISLNTYQNHEKGIFQASTNLLSLWFISHIRPWCCFMNICKICSMINSIERYIRIQSKLPKQSFLDWANFIKALTPDQIQWRINWPKISKAKITSREENEIPLLGLSGEAAYCPLRVIRQFGILQQVSPVWNPEEFAFDISSEIIPEEEKNSL